MSFSTSSVAVRYLKSLSTAVLQSKFTAGEGQVNREIQVCESIICLTDKAEQSIYCLDQELSKPTLWP